MTSTHARSASNTQVSKQRKDTRPYIDVGDKQTGWGDKRSTRNRHNIKGEDA